LNVIHEPLFQQDHLVGHHVRLRRCLRGRSGKNGGEQWD
jgi:hypothetical protein